MTISAETYCMFLIEDRLQSAYLTVDELSYSSACDPHLLRLALAHLELCERYLKESIREKRHDKKDNTRPNK